MNDFERCTFVNVQFGDCTALFLLFDRSRFPKCRINTESIGFTYGISPRDLNELSLIYLRRKQKKPDGTELVDALIQSYRQRKWYVGSAILELNFRRAAPMLSLRDLSALTASALNSGVLLDWDELRFCAKVLAQLHREERLPLLGLWLFLSAVQKGSNFGAESSIAELDRLLLEIMDELGDALEENQSHESILVELN